MPEFVTVGAVIVLSYILGSIPFGVITGQRVAGVDVRRLGSGNIGATNVLRALGVKPAVFVLALDIFKGAASVILGRMLAGGDVLPILCGASAVIGHNWSIFLRFGGGKGVATTGGVVIALMPVVSAALAALFVAVVAVTRYVSLASIIVALVLPLGALLAGYSAPYIAFSVFASIVVVWRHRSNIKRLRQGRENKLGVRIER